MTTADLMRMHDAQQGLCYLCGDPLPDDRLQIAVDHDHRCCPARKSCVDCRRGLTCHACNLVIGHAKDGPERLRRIADNLEAAMAAADERMGRRPAQLTLLSSPPVLPPLEGSLADVLKVFGGNTGMHWQVAADRLSKRFPGRWRGIPAGAVRAICRDLGVPTANVRMGEKVLAGCRRSDVEKALCRGVGDPAA